MPEGSSTPPPGHARTAAHAAGADSGDGSGPEPGHVLVVDDTTVNREMLVRRLTRRGHTIAEAVNGREALDRLAEEDFDLVLLDIMMPGMNGYEVLERMRGHDDLRHIPVILISALDDTESVVEGIQKGADDHLPKPFNTQILHARVETCLAKKRLHDREKLYARALAREIDIAREIQAGFLPDTLPAPPGWELAARFRPARTVAGDFYDAFSLDDGRVGVVVADVCGKGVGAALFMALFRTLLRSLADRFLSAHGDTDDEARRLLAAVNDYIATNHDGAHMFATIFLAVLDPATGELVYVNGGHDAPLLTGPDGIAGQLDPTGPAVGMLPGLEYESARTDIAPGQTLLVYTDGVIDARTPDGHAFSLDRLRDLLDRPADSAAATLDRIDDALRSHTGDTEPFDDITLLAVRRHG